MSEFTYSELKPQPQKLEAVVAFGERFARITTTTDRLKRHILEMAESQSVNGERMKDLLERVDFGICSPREYYRQKAEAATARRDRVVYTVAAKIVGNRELGIFAPSPLNNNRFDLLINPAAIAQVFVNRKTKRYGLGLPKEVLPEVAELGFLQVLNKLFTHESQHAIQETDPGSVALKEKYVRTAMRLVKLRLASIGVTVGLTCATVVTGLQGQPEVLAFGAGAWGAFGATNIIRIVEKLRYIRSFPEKEARSIADQVQTQDKSPFIVSFES